MSLIQRLFVFIAPLCFAKYPYLLRFTTRNTLVIRQYFLLKTQFSEKQSFFYSNYKKSVFKITHIAFSCLQFLIIAQNHLKSTLQNIQYSKKHFKYSSKALKSSLNTQKNSQKLSKVLKKNSLSLIFSIFQVLYHSFFSLNPTP